MYSTGAFSHVKDPALDKIIDDGANAIDAEVAKAKLMQAMKYVRTNHMAIPLIEYDLAFGASDRAKHWKPGLLPNFDSLFSAK
jgi:ABC-type oligopeptide transport system substrate-binding subunit